MVLFTAWSAFYIVLVRRLDHDTPLPSPEPGIRRSKDTPLPPDQSVRSYPTSQLNEILWKPEHTIMLLAAKAIRAKITAEKMRVMKKIRNHGAGALA